MQNIKLLAETYIHKTSEDCSLNWSGQLAQGSANPYFLFHIFDTCDLIIKFLLVRTLSLLMYRPPDLLLFTLHLSSSVSDLIQSTLYTWGLHIFSATLKQS